MVGEVGVYVGSARVAELKANNTYGERSLHQPEVRQANLIAHRVTVCLVLSKADFHN